MQQPRKRDATPERKRKTHNHAPNTITPERVSTPITRQHTGTITRAPAHRIEADKKNDLYTQGDV